MTPINERQPGRWTDYRRRAMWAGDPDVCPCCHERGTVIRNSRGKATGCISYICTQHERELAAHPRLTTVTLTTHHPERYRLINTHDGTEWIIRDGRWATPAEPVR